MNANDAGEVVSAGGIAVDLELLEATWCGRSLGLGPREVRVLARLMRARGRPVSVDALLEEFWREARVPSPDLVFASMARLRRGLRRVGRGGCVRTIPTVGYLFRL